MEKVGVVTVTYNSESVLKPFLDDLFSQTFKNFVLYVIDNASEDSTLQILDAVSDERLNLKCNEDNIGVAAANNIGIKNAKRDNCSHVLILNNDIHFSNNLLLDLLSTLRNINCGMVVPKIMYYDDKNIVWYAGGGFSKKKGYLPYHNGFNKNDNLIYNQSKFVDYAPTCCLLIKKEVFEDVGFMDEKYFVYFDDADFLYRVKKEGKHKVFYDPSIFLFHKVGSLTNSLFKNKNTQVYRSDFFLKQNIRNHIYFLRKSGGFYNFLYCLFLFFRNNMRFLFSVRIKKNISTFLKINKAYIEGWRL